MRATILQWFRRRRQAYGLAQADAEALIRDHGGEAYSEARQRERDMRLPDGTTHAGRTPAHWRRVALIVAKRTGHRVGLDTSTGMAVEADFSDRSESRGPELEPRKVDPIDELKRLIGDAETDPPHRTKVRKSPRHLRWPHGRR